MIPRFTALFFVTACFQIAIAWSQPLQTGGAAAVSDQVVTVEEIQVHGSRLDVSSVQMLTGLHSGQRINEAILRKAIQRMLESGLIRNVEYSYESRSAPASVILDLKIMDELPLLPATIELPGAEPENVWAYLKNVDPLFTRELPRTQKALAFYARYIERYLFTIRRPERVATVITADPSGNASGIVFVPASLFGTPQFRRKN